MIKTLNLETLKARIAVFAVVLVSFMASFGVAAQPASAASAMCYSNTGPTAGIWSPTNAVRIAKGGWCMHGGNGQRLVWQSDGNLVLYRTNSNTNAAWASNTAGRGQTLIFQGDGNIVIRNSAGTALWADTWEGGSLFSSSKNLAVTFKLNIFTSGNGSALISTAHYSGTEVVLWKKSF